MKNMAELIGIILGDGNIYVDESKSIYQLRIGGHSEDDKEYLLGYVKPLLEKLFKVNVRTKLHKSKKELFLCVDKKEVITKLIKLGVKPGNKKKNNIGIPSWIYTDIEYMKSFIRGIIDTDGSVYPKTLKHPCASIWLKCAIPKLRKDLTLLFKLLGFNPSKWSNTNRKDVKQCCIGRREEVIRFYQEINFKKS